MRTSALSFINVRVLTRNDKSLLVGRLVAPRLDIEYIGLDLTLIGCMKTSVSARLEL